MWFPGFKITLLQSTFVVLIVCYINVTIEANCSHSYRQFTFIATGILYDSNSPPNLRFPIYLRRHMTYAVLLCPKTQQNKHAMYCTTIKLFRWMMNNII